MRCRCGSYAINDHRDSGLCDKCWQRVRAEQALERLAAAERILRMYADAPEGSISGEFARGYFSP